MQRSSSPLQSPVPWLSHANRCNPRGIAVAAWAFAVALLKCCIAHAQPNVPQPVLAQTPDASSPSRSAGAGESTSQPPEHRDARRQFLQVGGYVHIDWVAFRQTSEDEIHPVSGDPLNESRFVLRRGRIRLERDEGYVHGALEVDTSTVRGLAVRPWNAEVSLKWPRSAPSLGPFELARMRSDTPLFAVTAGLLLVPFGADVPERENHRMFLERTTMASELFGQSYDLGVRMMAAYRGANYALAIVNGSPLGDGAFAGRDANAPKDLIARVGLTSLIASRVEVAAGLSGLTGRGFHAGSPATKDTLAWQDQNENGLVEPTELVPVPAQARVPSLNFSRLAIGADISCTIHIPVVGVVSMRGEIVRAKNLARGMFVADPIAASRDVRQAGASLSVTYEPASWLTFAFRHDGFNPDSDAREAKPFAVVAVDPSLSTSSFAAITRWHATRLTVQYDSRHNALGRDSANAPTTLADDSLTVRAGVTLQ